MRKIVSILVMVTICLPLFGQGTARVISKIAVKSEPVSNWLTKTDNYLLRNKPTSSFLNLGGIQMQASTGSLGNLLIPQTSVLRTNIPPYLTPIPQSRYFVAQLSGNVKVIPDQYIVMDRLIELSERKDSFQLYSSAMSFPFMDEILTKYIESNKISSDFLLKYPVIVSSYSLWDGVGGHNFSSRITPVKIDNSLATGQFMVENVIGDFLRQIEKPGLIGTNSFTAEAPMVRPRKLVFDNVENRTDQLHVKREASGFRVDEKTVSSMDDLFVELEQRISNGENLSGKTIIFEKFNDYQVRLIMDNVDQGIVSKGFAPEFDVRGYDLSAIEYDQSLAAEGITIVKVPIKPKAVRIAPDGEAIEYIGKNIFKKIYHSFKMKSSSVDAFVAKFKSFVKGRKGMWNDFLFKQDLKKNGINPDEINEAFNYIIAQLIVLTDEEDDVFAT